MRYRALSQATETVPGGDYTFGQSQANFLINSPAAVAQSVTTRLKLWLGEWFLDTTVGTPWLQQVLGKNTQSLYDTAIRTVVLQTVGVLSIEEYTSTLDSQNRSLAVSMTINTIYGTAPVQVVL